METAASRGLESRSFSGTLLDYFGTHKNKTVTYLFRLLA